MTLERTKAVIETLLDERDIWWPDVHDEIFRQLDEPRGWYFGIYYETELLYRSRTWQHRLQAEREADRLMGRR